jgi:hypothetical protein
MTPIHSSCWRCCWLKLGTLLITLAATHPAAAQEGLTRQDTVAAGAIYGQAAIVEGVVSLCEEYVDDAAQDARAVTLESWQDRNRDLMEMAEKVMDQMLIMIAATSGPDAEVRMRAQIDSMRRNGMTQVRTTIESLPEPDREGRCYGVLTAINQGDFDIRSSLPEQVEYLEARASVVTWM